jgi:hypothetical protein
MLSAKNSDPRGTNAVESIRCLRAKMHLVRNFQVLDQDRHCKRTDNIPNPGFITQGFSRNPSTPATRGDCPGQVRSEICDTLPL